MAIIGRNESVPLRGLAIKAHVVDMVSEVEVSQRYFNDADVAIEAVYVVLTSTRSHHVC